MIGSIKTCDSLPEDKGICGGVDAFEIKNLNKSYGKTEVYKNFNLALKKGAVTCVLGESGSGKTTLLNCVAGLTEFTGQVPKVKCSYVFQTPRLAPNLTVRKNLQLICSDGEKIDEILRRVRLDGKADEYPKNLSGGQAQRVALARAFLFDSDIILMDEPFASLDLKLKREMIALFFEIWRKDGRTALFVTHDIDEAVSVAHRVIVLKGGKVAFDISPESLPPRELGGDETFRKTLINALLQ